MTRTELHWFALRFPRDLQQDSVLAALSACSGLAHGSRLVLDLRASHHGITHQLGISPKATDAALGNLRAAIPSLRVQDSEGPAPLGGHRWLWQLSPAVAALRTDDLPAISASLLSSLFPLKKNETVLLRWTLRPAPRPPLPDMPDSQADGRLRALRAKLSLPGLSAGGELHVQAGSTARSSELTQRVAAVLRSLATPHGRLLSDPYWYGQAARLLGRRGRFLSSAELVAVIGWPIDSPLVPGLELGAAKRLVPGAALPTAGRILGQSDYAGMTRPVALTPAASTRGLYVLGPTGTGKTSLLRNLIRDDLQQGRGLAVVETNGDLIQDLIDAVPPERINDVVLLDPTDPTHAIGFNPFASSADPSLVADQISELFARLWHAYWGPRTGQLAHMGLLTLTRRRGSTLLDLPRLYLDQGFRRSVLASLDDPVGLGPDWQWFDGLGVREQSTVIAPLLNKVRQFTARPSIRAIVGQPAPATSIREIVASNKVLLVHLPKGLIGSETAQLLGCLVLTAIWQTAAERAALPKEQRTPYGLYVDEVQDFASAPVPWDEMAAQGRKYGLALTIAHQNLGQLPRELRETVLANARSKAVFALSSSDAKALEPLFAPALTTADLQALDAFAVAALVALDDGATSRPVTLTTPPPPPPLGSAAGVRAASRSSFARPRIEIEAALRQQAGGTLSQRTAPVGRRPRSRS